MGEMMNATCRASSSGQPHVSIIRVIKLILVLVHHLGWHLLDYKFTLPGKEAVAMEVFMLREVKAGCLNYA